MFDAATESVEQKEGKLSNRQCSSKQSIKNQRCAGEFELQCRGKVLEEQDLLKNNSQNMNIKHELKVENNPAGDVELSCRSSMSRLQKQQTVCVRSAYKRYGNKSDPVIVLHGLDMTVPKGAIYGLLGASGCGKTTLLNCIVGLERLDSGEIRVLDGPPGCRSSGVPGPRVGYMPQGTALYGDFTIRETFVFFGWIAGMTSEKIQERIEFLVKLLMLPNANQRVKTLSGGQQRRVSLATALLHEPELLILDEPTVGLDSVLREDIWRHFWGITKDGHTTVVITTHYIDEARNAHRVALMRGGYFLVEESPEKLLRQYGLDTLERLFYKLSDIQDSKSGQQFLPKQKPISPDGDQNGTTATITVSTEDQQEVTSTDTNVSKTPSKGKIATDSCNYFPYPRRHMKALFWKNFLWMIRNFHITLFILMSPFATMSLLCLCIGRNPVDLTMAVVNHETNNVMTCEDKLTCNNSQLSCQYFKYLEKHNITMIPYESESDARESVLKGKTYASIVVKHNYSAALHSRVQDWQYATSWEIQSSEIDVFRDVSSKLVANYIKALLYDTFQSFLQDYMAICNIKSKWLTSAITVSPVYGKSHSTFTDYIIPGVLLTFLCMLSAGVTIVILMIEHNEGLLERILVSGVSKIELLTAHVICQSVIMVLLTTIALISIFVVFNTETKGSFLLIVILSLMVGFCGMCFGLCVSCASDRMAFHVVSGSLFPTMMLSGIIWPTEGMHRILKPLAVALPLTHATESMRSIMVRGWGASEEAVYMGFVSITIWTIIFLIIIALIVRFKKD